MAKRVVCIAGLLLAAFVSHAVAADERRVTAREAEAIAIALADFKSKQGRRLMVAQCMETCDTTPSYWSVRAIGCTLSLCQRMCL